MVGHGGRILDACDRLWNGNLCTGGVACLYIVGGKTSLHDEILHTGTSQYRSSLNQFLKGKWTDIVHGELVCKYGRQDSSR